MYTLMNSSKTERAYSDLDTEELNIENLYTTVGTGNSGRSYNSNPLSNINGGVVVVATIVAFVVAILLFVLVVQKKKAPRGRFMKWLREYLNFRSILISGIIKFVYIFLAVLLTIMSVVVMCQGRDETILPMIGVGLAMMVFGNIFLRIMMELTMAIIMMWDNTSDIRGVLVKEEERPEDIEPKSPEVEPVPVPEPTQGAKVEEINTQPIAEETVVTEQQIGTE